jgi:hypothetical protein
MQTMNVNTIITRALKMVRAESFYSQENQDARQYVIETLNDILSTMSLEAELVPYNKVFSFNLTAGVAQYIVGTSLDATIVTPETMATIDYVNLINAAYRYVIKIVDNFSQLYSGRVLNSRGRPAEVRINAENLAFKLDFYTVPDSNYNVELLYRPTIAEVQYQDNIVLPIGYRTYIIYYLAKRISLENSMKNWMPENEKELLKAQAQLFAYINSDNRIRSAPPIMPGSRMYYQYNLGMTPP